MPKVLYVCLPTVCKYSIVKGFEQFWTTCCLKSFSCYLQCELKMSSRKRKCKNDPGYICGQLTLLSQRKSISDFVKKSPSSILYFSTCWSGLLLATCWTPHKVCNVTRSREWKEEKRSHYVKSVQIRSFSWSVFSRIRTEYWEILGISPYSLRMRENMDQKELRIWTLFRQFLLRIVTENKHSQINLQRLGKVWVWTFR